MRQRCYSTMYVRVCVYVRTAEETFEVKTDQCLSGDCVLFNVMDRRGITKMQVFQALVISVLVYGAETWLGCHFS